MVMNPGVREMSKERAKALDLAVQQIERQFVRNLRGRRRSR